MPAAGPTFARMLLGTRLAALREAAEVTTQDVEDRGLFSKPSLWRIETGRQSVSPASARALGRLYRAGADELRELQRLAEMTTERGAWWPWRAVVPAWFRLYMDMEMHAARITMWEDSVIPGELQTEGYARALWRDGRPDVGADLIDAQVTVRMHRQRTLLDRAAPPELHTVIGEGALRRQVGGAAVMAAQLDHLRDLAGREGVDVLFLPFAAGATPASGGAFRILEFAGGQVPAQVYVETETSATYLTDPGDLDTYLRISRRLTGRARPLGEFAG